MADSISKNTKRLLELQSEINKQNEGLRKLKEELLESNKKIESLRNEELTTKESIEEEKKVADEMTKLSLVIDSEAKTDALVDFNKEMLKKIKKPLIKEVDKIIGEKETELEELRKVRDESEKKYQAALDAHKKAEELALSAKTSVEKALAELRGLPAQLIEQKQKARKYEILMRDAERSKNESALYFFSREMEKTLQEIQRLGRSKNDIVTRTDKSSSEAAGKAKDDLKSQLLKIQKELDENKRQLQLKEKAREDDILKTIRSTFPD